MRATSAKWAATIAASHRVFTRVYGDWGAQKGVPVPILSGSITFDASTNARRRATIVVPLVDEDGTVWAPGADPDHPLAPLGQTLTIHTGLYHDTGEEEFMNLGDLLVDATDVDEVEGTVTVTCIDRWAKVEAARMGENWAHEVNRGWRYTEFATALGRSNLGYGAGLWNLNVEVYPPPQFLGLSDVQMQGRIECPTESSRTEAIRKLCDLWSASAYYDDSGRMTFAKAITAPAAKAVWTVENGKTLVNRGYAAARTRIYNVVYASAYDATTGERTAGSGAYYSTGPYAVSGSMGYVPRWFGSTLLRTQAECERVAQTILARGTVYARTETVECVPNPALELNDTVDVVSDRGGRFRGLVAAIKLPLTAAGGPMELTVTSQTADEMRGPDAIPRADPQH